MDDLDQIATSRLGHVGQRYSTNRRKLVRTLASADGPLTIPEIIGQGDDLAQSSVYRNLVVLAEADLVRKIVTTDEWTRYELAEDLTEHHHHLVCTGCGMIRDFTVSAPLERSLDKALASVAAESGFTMQHHRLDLVGLCEACAVTACSGQR